MLGVTAVLLWDVYAQKEKYEWSYQYSDHR